MPALGYPGSSEAAGLHGPFTIVDESRGLTDHGTEGHTTADAVRETWIVTVCHRVSEVSLSLSSTQQRY